MIHSNNLQKPSGTIIHYICKKNDPQRQILKKKINAEFELPTLMSLKVFSSKAYVWEMYLLRSLRLYIWKCPRQAGNIQDFQNFIKACQIAKLEAKYREFSQDAC